ncbi:hypothetical protein CYLTODRAFT_476015 [Cylindrobasidium torrendii FP15055 ss-10]|uniref:F-box domain-containing protein n=1 Tax=Cylindrobasidium torrendii FP15055 ss-10 TaxID=1314674 RepID=A0A0D7BI92_9AGAR|nr:hypothetical protein CYLTODRAFT_476015 [Cylindrobasidium torrendii FP15055 ss-10]
MMQALCPDVLQLIFLEACGPYILTGGHGSSYQPFQHTILDVCKHWNSVATGYAPLWSNIVMRRFKAVLRLARGSLLTIKLDYSCDYNRYPSETKSIDILTKEVFATSPRWRSFTIQGNTPWAYFLVLRGNIPNLETLDISAFHTIDNVHPDDRMALSDAFIEAPVLVNVVLPITMCMMTRFFFFNLPWHQTRSLSFRSQAIFRPRGCSYLHSYLSRLSASSSLTYLELDMHHQFHGEDNFCPNPIDLPSVEAVKCNSTDCLAMLNLPNLKYADIRMTEAGRECSDAMLDAFDQHTLRSGCSLEGLDIDCSPSGFAPIMRHSKTLRRLDVVSSSSRPYTEEMRDAGLDPWAALLNGLPQLVELSFPMNYYGAYHTQGAEFAAHFVCAFLHTNLRRLNIDVRICDWDDKKGFTTLMISAYGNMKQFVQAAQRSVSYSDICVWAETKSISIKILPDENECRLRRDRFFPPLYIVRT